MKKILLVILITAASAYAQISPGDLTKAHANLEGLGNCTKCHDLGNKLTNKKCLDCHEEIKLRIDKSKGYHSSKDVTGKNCWNCHSEHNGRNFEIIHFNKKAFDHNKTGFILSGSHKNIDCGKCHKSDFIGNPELKKLKNTYLGLSTECINCHEDVHQKTLGSNCSSCHTTIKFIPAALFDHNKSQFKLTGMHIQTKCDKCHIKGQQNGKLFQKFAGLNFKLCTDCHKDIHNNKFGNDCSKCHTADSFKNVNKKSFDHDKTNYKLIGKHTEVLCAKCHGNNLSSKPKHNECIDCHKDFHSSQFKTGLKLTDCKVCHNENGFSPSVFTLNDHNKLQFKLTGGHLATPCGECHFKQNVWVFKKLEEKCAGCHKNIHGTEISNKFMGNGECSNCHITDSWTKVNFDHSKTEFVLKGKHAGIKCGSCHEKTSGGTNKLAFNSLSTECESCHKDIHNNQFRKKTITRCESCHGFDTWPKVSFDHSKTNFQLTGAHQNTACGKCHKEVEENGIIFIKYKIENFKCADCHL